MRYWVYLNGEVPGSYEPQELAALPGFGGASMVCPAEGGYEVRNWRHAAEFPEISTALQAQEKPRRLSEPMAAADAVRQASLGAHTPQGRLEAEQRQPSAGGPPQSADEILSDASSRIFRHVSELMKELENRREERAVAQSLQRQSAELKNELLALRERNKFLQDRVDLIPGYEATVEKLQAQAAQLAAELSERERAIAESERRAKSLGQELQGVRLNESHLAEDLKRQTALCQELSDQLAAKEFTLIKAFGLIRRLESELSDILPGSVAGIRRELGEPIGTVEAHRPEHPEAVGSGRPGPADFGSPGRPLPERAQETQGTPEDETPEPSPEAGPPPAETALPEIRVREPEIPDIMPQRSGDEVRAPEPEAREEAPPAPAQAEEPVPEAPTRVVADALEPPDERVSSVEEPPAPAQVSNDEPAPAPGTADLAGPTEGEVRPVPPPWQAALGKLAGHVRDMFSLRGSARVEDERDPHHPPPPPPAP